MNNYVNDAKERLRNTIYTGTTRTAEQAELDALLVDSEVGYTSAVENDELRPSQTTLEYKGTLDYDFLDHKTTKAVEVSVNQKYKISTKGKVLIAVYMMLVVMIFAFIAFNANYLRSLDNKIEAKEQKVVDLQTEVDEKVLELENIDKVVIETAKEWGMIQG